MTETVKHAAEEIDALPTNRREAIWLAMWNGAVVGTMVLVMEYAVFSPFWHYVVLPLWEWVT